MTQRFGLLSKALFKYLLLLLLCTTREICQFSIKRTFFPKCIHAMKSCSVINQRKKTSIRCRELNLTNPLHVAPAYGRVTA